MIGMAFRDLQKSEVADRIRFFRQAKEMTQEDLGRAMGAGTRLSAKATVAKIEGGQVPGGLRLGRLTKALGCSADMILSGQSRELMEVIRYYVPVPEKGTPYQINAFRVARLFLFCAIASGQTEGDDEFVEAANRLFYLADRDPKGCAYLFSSRSVGGLKADLLTAKRDVRGLVRHAMRSRHGGADPEGYRDYRFGVEKLEEVAGHYITPEQPAMTRALLAKSRALPAPKPETPCMEKLSEENGLPEGPYPIPTGQGVLKLDDESLMPIARPGQTVIVAAPERKPEVGDLVVCWAEGEAARFGRLVKTGRETELMSLNPNAFSLTSLPRKKILSLRVITGVLFE